MSTNKTTKGTVSSFFGVVLLFVSLTYSGWMMSHAFGGDFHRGYLGHNGARYSIMARNVLRYDVAEFSFVPLLNAACETEPDMYLHHPPLLHWVMAFVFRVFGEAEDHVRMVPCLFTLLNLVMVYLLGRRILGGSLPGGACALMAAALPMTSFYGAHIDVQGSPLVFCMLASTYCFCQWLVAFRKAWLFPSLVFLALGTLFDWPALYLCPLFPIYCWMSSRRLGGDFAGALRKTWPFVATGFALFLLLVVWLAMAGTPKGTTLFESLIARSVKPEAAGFEIGSYWDYFIGSLGYCIPTVHSLYPFPFLLLLLLGWVFRKNGSEESGHLFHVLLMFFLLGTLHMVFFPTSVLFHDYWVFLYMPWVAIGTGSALCRIAAFARSRTAGKAVGFAAAAAVALAIMAAGHLYSLDRFEREIDWFTSEFGKAIHDVAAPGDAVLSNALHCNSYDPRAPEGVDRYVFSKPALTFYADRVVRGNIRTVEQFEDALKRRDDFVFFAFINSAAYKEKNRELFLYLESRYPVEKKVHEVVFFRIGG